MLSGDHYVTLDDTGRIALPRGLRDVLEKDQVVLTKGADSCLWLYPVAEWEEQERIIRNTTDRYSKNGRIMLQHFIGSKKYLDMDKQGRILIPPTLRDHAGLSKDCVILGLYDYAEVWAVDRYRAHMGSHVGVIDAGLEELGRKVRENRERRDGDDTGNSAHSGAAGGNHTLSRAEGQG